jgi:hypothetical protein
VVFDGANRSLEPIEVPATIDADAERLARAFRHTLKLNRP